MPSSGPVVPREVAAHNWFCGRALLNKNACCCKNNSGASFNSRPGSKSVAGGYRFLGRHHNPTSLNAAVLKACSAIPVVCAAASEAEHEHAGVLGNRQVAVDGRSMLASSGYPRPPAVVGPSCCVAMNVLLASFPISAWVGWARDRACQAQSAVPFVPGKKIIWLIFH